MAFIRRHPVLIYTLLTFAISWGAIVIAIGPAEVLDTEANTEAMLPIAILAMMLGPCIAGILMTALVHGRDGLRDLLSRSTKWRVTARWYAVALLTAPVSVLASLLLLSLVSPEFLPGIITADDKSSILMFAVVAGIAVAIFEEIGWTGFAVPELSRRHGILSTGLAVGAIWGAWHLLVNVWGSSDASASVPMIVFLPVVLFSFLPAYRVLMVWLYDRTGSVLLCILMHACLIAFWQLSTPDSIAGASLVTWYVVWAVVLWIMVAAVALFTAQSGTDSATVSPG